MQEFVKNLAADEGWTPATTVDVLARTLEAMVGMGIDQKDIEAIIRREGGADGSLEEDEGPEEGDVVHMRKHEARIVVAEVPEDQPERDGGIWTIVDEDGETHRIERDDIDDPWYVVVPAI